MKIAIIGAGYAGLSVAWHLLHESKFSAIVDVFDPLPIGSGTSGNSSGLLHPYPGQDSRRSWEAEAGMNGTHDLIGASARAINAPLVLSKGIFRPACSEEQRLDFLNASEKFSDVEWWSQSTCLEKIPYLHFGSLKKGGGIFIKSGLTINVKRYLEGLWQAVAKSGATHIPKKMSSSEGLVNYDRIVFCMGAETIEILALPIKCIKGQLLKLRWPTHLPPLPHSLIGKGYVVMSDDHRFCYAGATFERDFQTKEADTQTAKKIILEKITPFLPQLEKAEIVDTLAGVRATTPRHLPIVDHLEDNYWIFTALGSKGLLLHGFLGQRLAKAILQDDPTIIPNEVRLSSH